MGRAKSGIAIGELLGEFAMPVRSQASLCAADVHSGHAAETFDLFGVLQVLSTSVFAAGQTGNSFRQSRCHRTRNPHPASGGHDAGEIAYQAKCRCDHIADGGPGIQVRLDVDVRIALAHLYPLASWTWPARQVCHCRAIRLAASMIGINRPFSGAGDQ
jgi:hypothetical protein